MNIDFPLLISIAGLVTFVLRMKVLLPTRAAGPTGLENLESQSLVSIIVPCRNEAANLPTLIASLRNLTYANYEILIVDDASSDDTYRVAADRLRGFPNARILRAPPKPAEWGGKNWPCHIGAEGARGEYLLFTDADTVHGPQSLATSVTFLKRNRLDLMTAVPFHRCTPWWERCLGLFYLLPLIATAFSDKPRCKRVFAIGQYLLFTRSSYFETGGHATVASSLAEDIDLAEIRLGAGKRYGVFSRPGLFEVQMYRSFQDFWNGWRRLLRLGLFRSGASSVVEVTLVLYLFLFSWFEWRLEVIAISFLGMMALLIVQQRHGRFSVLGAFLPAFSILLFIGLSLIALVDFLSKRNIEWHGRSYTKDGSQSPSSLA